MPQFRLISTIVIFTFLSGCGGSSGLSSDADSSGSADSDTSVGGSTSNVSTADAHTAGGGDNGDNGDNGQPEEDPGIDLEWATQGDGGQDESAGDAGDADADVHAPEEIAFDASDEADVDEGDEFVYYPN